MILNRPEMLHCFLRGETMSLGYVRNSVFIILVFLITLTGSRAQNFKDYKTPIMSEIEYLKRSSKLDSFEIVTIFNSEAFTKLELLDSLFEQIPEALESIELARDLIATAEINALNIQQNIYYIQYELGINDFDFSPERREAFDSLIDGYQATMIGFIDISGMLTDKHGENIWRIENKIRKLD